jgi:hypothetical protein
MRGSTPKSLRREKAQPSCRGRDRFCCPNNANTAGRTCIGERPGPWYFPPISRSDYSGRVSTARHAGKNGERRGRQLPDVRYGFDGHRRIRTRRNCLLQWWEHRTTDGSDALKALSWEEVRRIVGKFGKLNPYNPKIVPSSILNIVAKWAGICPGNNESGGKRLSSEKRPKPTFGCGERSVRQPGPRLAPRTRIWEPNTSTSSFARARRRRS